MAEPRPNADEPHPDRFSPDDPAFTAAMSAHDRAVEHGEPGYIDLASGLFVLTSRYLLERGHCCDRGCRHCPWLPLAATE